MTLAPDTATLLVAESRQLNATLKASSGTVLTGRTVEWSSSDSAVAKVSPSGLVEGTGPGTATISATSEGIRGRARITVRAPNPAPSITSLDPAAVTAGRRAFTLVVRGTGFSAASVVRWNGQERQARLVGPTQLEIAVQDEAVATAGPVEVSVENPAPGGGSAARTLEVAAGPSVRILADSVLLTVGDTTWLQARRLDGDGRTLSTADLVWERVEEEAIGFGLAPESGRARVRAQGLGRFRLIARAAEGVSDTVTVRVRTIPQHLVSVLPGVNTSCGLDTEGRAYCWGSAYFDGPRAGEVYAPAPLSGQLHFRQISVGHQHGCGIALDGRAYCWGINDYGMLGTGGPPTGTGWTPAAVATGRTYAEIATRGWHSCGLLPSGDLECWGANDYGQVGDGTLEDRFTPVAVGGGVRFASISIGPWHNCGLDEDGRAYCWGANSYGQLGRGTLSPQEALPAAVATDLRFAAVAVGGFHTCALTADGETYCWGGNEYGQLGIGSTATYGLDPAAVAGGHRFTSLDASFHTCGRTQTGEVYCWGLNDSGSNGVAPGASESCIVGNWHYACNRTPVSLTGSLAFAAVRVGGWHTCGMSTDGRPFCWGEDHDGQLGVGRRGGYSVVPLQVYDGRMANTPVPDRAVASGASPARSEMSPVSPGPR